MLTIVTQFRQSVHIVWRGLERRHMVTEESSGPGLAVCWTPHASDPFPTGHLPSP